MNYAELVDEIVKRNPNAKFADGLEAALVGYAVVKGRTVALYSNAKVCKILRDRDGMDQDEAYEFFEFNIAGAYIGADTPIFHYFQWDHEEPETDG